MSRWFALATAWVGALSLAGVGWGQTASRIGPPLAYPTTPAPTSAPAIAAAAPIDPEVERILDRLEKRGDTVRDLSCRVRQEMLAKVVGEKITKEGDVKYLRGSDGNNARFIIHFAKITQDDFPIKPETYAFDGRWFTEAKESTKSVLRREIVRPGEKLNLFSVEESPFPLPFGQKKAEILKNFDVKLVPPEAKDPADTNDSKHLLCIPKPGTHREQEYKEIHFYIDPKLDLPKTIVAYRKTGTKVSEIQTVTFPDLTNKSINKSLPVSAFDFKVPVGWSVSEERLEAREVRGPGVKR